MLNTICTRKEKTRVFLLFETYKMVIQFGELLLCAGTAKLLSLVFMLSFEKKKKIL